MPPGTRLGWSFVDCSVDSQLDQEEEHFEMVSKFLNSPFLFATADKQKIN